MIGRIRGTLIEKQPPDVLIDVAGVGYEVQLPMTCFYELPNCQEEVTLFTHFVVREDAQLLFGFNTKKTRALFRELLKANGVGPKLGLAILSGMSADEFVRCVHNEDASTLVKLPGVGKKTAERLVLELKDRLKNWQGDLLSTDDSQFLVAQTDPTVQGDVSDDAIAALISLGYKANQAEKAVKSVRKVGMSSEALIKESLKAML